MDQVVSSFVEVQVVNDIDDGNDEQPKHQSVLVPVSVLTGGHTGTFELVHHDPGSSPDQQVEEVVISNVVVEDGNVIVDNDTTDTSLIHHQHHHQEQEEQQQQEQNDSTEMITEEQSGTRIYNRKGQIVATLMDDDLEFYQFLVKHFEPKRSVWMRSEFKTRDSNGEFATIFPGLRNEPELFRRQLGVLPHTFDLILNAIKPMIEKTSQFRKCISPEHRLYVTLKFLLFGTKFRTLENQLHISHQSISKIVVETSRVIYQVLRKRYIPFPNVEQFEEIANDFREKTNFPHCLGAVDAKHIRISSPVNKNPRFKHYRGHFFVVVQGVCDSNYRFTCVDVSAYAADNPDGGKFSNTTFGEKLLTQTIPIPESRPLNQQQQQTFVERDDDNNGGNNNSDCNSNNEESVPFVWVGDRNFPLHPNLMRPFDERGISDVEKLFNERLSYAQRYIEYTFGILYNKWNCLNVKLDMLPTNVDQVILACCVLHNAIIEHEGMSYTEEQMENMRNTYVESRNRSENNVINNGSIFMEQINNKCSEQAKNTRYNFLQYFLNSSNNTNNGDSSNNSTGNTGGNSGSMEDHYQVFPEYIVTSQNLL